MPQHLSNSQAQIKLSRMRIKGLFAVLFAGLSAVEKTIRADPALRPSALRAEQLRLIFQDVRVFRERHEAER